MFLLNFLNFSRFFQIFPDFSRFFLIFSLVQVDFCGLWLHLSWILYGFSRYSWFLLIDPDFSHFLSFGFPFFLIDFERSTEFYWVFLWLLFLPFSCHFLDLCCHGFRFSTWFIFTARLTEFYRVLPSFLGLISFSPHSFSISFHFYCFFFTGICHISSNPFTILKFPPFISFFSLN